MDKPNNLRLVIGETIWSCAICLMKCMSHAVPIITTSPTKTTKAVGRRDGVKHALEAQQTFLPEFT